MRTLLALALASVALASQAMVIDDFSDGDFVSSHNGVGSTFANVGASVPGGIRTVGNITTSNPFNLNSTITRSTGVLFHSLDTLVTGSMSLAYGNLAPLNLDLSTDNAFTVDVLSNDLSANLQIEVFSSTNGTATSLVHNVGPVTFGSPVTVTFNFSEFGMSMNDVDKITLSSAGVANNDIAIDNFQSVPEPATLVFGFAALAGFAAKRRRK